MAIAGCCRYPRAVSSCYEDEQFTGEMHNLCYEEDNPFGGLTESILQMDYMMDVRRLIPYSGAMRKKIRSRQRSMTITGIKTSWMRPWNARRSARSKSYTGSISFGKTLSCLPWRTSLKRKQTSAAFRNWSIWSSPAASSSCHRKRARHLKMGI